MFRELFITEYLERSNAKIYHNPKDRTLNWRIPATVGIFGILRNLVHRVRLQTDNRREDGALQTLKSCDC